MGCPGRRGWEKRSGNPGNRAEVAELVDAVRCENGCIVQLLFPDTDPAQLVTDSSYLSFRTYHSNDASLAGDTIKRCMKRQDFSIRENRQSPGSGRMQCYEKNTAGVRSPARFRKNVQVNRVFRSMGLVTDKNPMS